MQSCVSYCSPSQEISFLSTPKLVVEVVAEAELEPVVVDLKAVAEVVPATPLEFGAVHYVLGGVVLQVEQGVLATTEVRCVLQRSVVDSQIGITGGAGPVIAPVDVVEGDPGPHRQWPAIERPSNIQRGCNRSHIDGRVIHIVLNAVPVGVFALQQVLLTHRIVGADADAPAPGVTAKVEGARRAGVEIVPGDIAADARDLEVVFLSTPAEARGQV